MFIYYRCYASNASESWLELALGTSLVAGATSGHPIEWSEMTIQEQELAVACLLAENKLGHGTYAIRSGEGYLAIRNGYVQGELDLSQIHEEANEATQYWASYQNYTQKQEE